MIGMWTIDPIDGTKGFLRGEQYAVCLSFLVDGNPIVGVIGCPNLPHRNGGSKGYIFVAVKDQGSERVGILHLSHVVAPTFAIAFNGGLRSNYHRHAHCAFCRCGCLGISRVWPFIAFFQLSFVGALGSGRRTV